MANIEEDNGGTFQNAMIKNALKSLTTEQLAHYQSIGENMFKNVDFAKNQILNNVDPPTEEKLQYIIAGLKSGLSPLDMEQNEIELMIKYYGENWFEEFGFNKEDIGELAQEVINYMVEFDKCGRNQSCPCKSGKKYKFCHGKNGNKNMIRKI